MNDEATPQAPATNPTAAPETQPTPQPAQQQPPSGQQALNLPGTVPAQPPKQDPPPTQPEKPKGSDENPAWLPSRLEQARGNERSKILKAAGVESEEQLTERLKRLNELEAEKLTEAERQQKVLEQAQQAAARGAQFEKPFTDYVNARFGALTPEQQALIDSKANGDPLLRHEGIQYLDAVSALVPQQQTPPPAQPQPKPASTSPEVPKPPPVSGGPPKTKFEEWRVLAENPKTSLQASFFYRANKHAIDASRPTEN